MTLYTYSIVYYKTKTAETVAAHTRWLSLIIRLMIESKGEFYPNFEKYPTDSESALK